jgi:hypothetical protein
MDDKKTNPIISRFCVWWALFVEELTRHFLTCNGNHCGLSPFYVDDTGGGEYVHAVDILIDEQRETIYAYFCPMCGRRLTTKCT